MARAKSLSIKRNCPIFPGNVSAICQNCSKIIDLGSRCTKESKWPLPHGVFSFMQYKAFRALRNVRTARNLTLMAAIAQEIVMTLNPSAAAPPKV